MAGVVEHIPLFIGVMVTFAIGFFVGPIVRRVGAEIGPLPAPSEETTAEWSKLAGQKTGGSWIGLFERLIFFASFWVTGAWPLLSSWLVFKLAIYWQGTNFSAFPPNPPTDADMKYLVAKRQMGTHHVATLLVGTGANIVIALIGVAIGRWIRVH